MNTKNQDQASLQIKMNIVRSQVSFKRLKDKELRQWQKIPTSIAGDSMNRQNVMSSRISSIREGMTLCGQARTVSVTHGDNSAIHAALTIINKGEILVVEGGGFEDRAVWGELMSLSSIHIGLGGVVIDGAVRDLRDLKKMNLPLFASGRTAAGPTKGGGGKVDIPISCGNVALKPGDIIIGDDDGVAVIPFEIQNQYFQDLQETKAHAYGDLAVRLLKHVQALQLQAHQMSKCRLQDSHNEGTPAPLNP